MIRGRPLKPAVFLDRDGVIVEEVNHLSRPEQLRLIAGVSQAIRRLNAHQLPVVIVTNQSAVARGLITETGLKIIHHRLVDLLAAAEARVDGIYYCPHHPEIGEPPYRAVCTCRKPEAGLFRAAATELGLDLNQSVMIGDTLRDLEAGRKAGCRYNVLVLTGHGHEEQGKLADISAKPDFVAPEIGNAVDWLLRTANF
jgi:D-glycero-D-manno-heptose 1,7-bisphosphate phosphatase